MTVPPPSGPYGTQPGGQLPVCPRHPDRVAYVRCQRCGRPVCPECQRQASVGVQCVDCVTQGQAEQRAIRTRFGGRDRGGYPVVTIGIVALCVAAYLLVQFVDVRPRLYFAPVNGETEPYRFLTAAFLHAGFLHIAVNMYALWILGSVLEPMFGRWRFIALYLLSALGGSVAVLLLASPNDISWVTPVVGASGAVFGLFAAVGLTLRRMGRDTTQILVLLVINAVIGFTIPSISWQAHLGGLLTGALLGAAYVYAPRSRRQMVAVVATIGVTVLLVALAVLRYAAV